MLIDDNVIKVLNAEINYIKELLKTPSAGSNRDALRALAISFAQLIHRDIADIESAYQTGKNAEEKDESTKAKNAVNHYPYGYVGPDELKRIKDAEFKFTDLLIDSCDEVIKEREKTKETFDSIINDPMAPGIPDKMRYMLEISKPENLDKDHDTTIQKVKALRNQKKTLEIRKQQQGGVLLDPKDQDNLDRLEKKEVEIIESSRLDLKSKLIVQAAKQVVEEEKGRKIDHKSEADLREVAQATKGVAKVVEKGNIDLDPKNTRDNYLDINAIRIMRKEFVQQAVKALKKEKVQGLVQMKSEDVPIKIKDASPSPIVKGLPKENVDNNLRVPERLDIKSYEVNKQKPIDNVESKVGPINAENVRPQAPKIKEEALNDVKVVEPATEKKGLFSKLTGALNKIADKIKPPINSTNKVEPTMPPVPTSKEGNNKEPSPTRPKKEFRSKSSEFIQGLAKAAKENGTVLNINEIPPVQPPKKPQSNLPEKNDNPNKPKPNAGRGLG